MPSNRRVNSNFSQVEILTNLLGNMHLSYLDLKILLSFMCMCVCCIQLTNMQSPIGYQITKIANN